MTHVKLINMNLTPARVRVRIPVLQRRVIRHVGF